MKNCINVEVLQNAFKATGIEKSEFAKKCGVRLTELDSFLSGGTKIKMTSLFKIMDELKINFGDFVYYE